MCMCEQWRLYCTGQWGRWKLLSEHVFSVASHSKWLSKESNKSASNFALKLEHSSMEVIQMTQKAAAMDNWWFTALPRQHACSYVMSRAGFFGETSNHPGDSAALQPRCGTLRLLAFPTTKITFERAEISDHRWDSGRYDGIADGNWENCVRS